MRTRNGLHKTAFILLTALLTAAPALAEEAIELPGIVIAAGLEPIEEDKVGSAYTVVSGEELEARQIRHAGDALRAVAGVHVSRSGSFGGLTQLRLRGAEGNHVLVLIDGIEVSAPGNGEFDFSNLLAADIERIEVLRGPQSGVYGSNAMAGVVNIITKKGDGPLTLTAAAEGGSFSTHQESVSVRGGNDGAHVAFTLATRRSAGFNISNFGNETDGSRNDLLAFKAGVKPLENLSVDVVARYQSKHTKDDPQDFAFPATPTYGLVIDGIGTTDTDEFFARSGAKLDLLDGLWRHKVWGTFTDSDTDAVFFDFFAFPAGPGTLFNHGQRVKGAYQTSVHFDLDGPIASKHVVTGLAEYEREIFTSNSSGGERKRGMQGTVLEYQGDFADRLALTGTVRRDRNSGFQDATTWRTAASLRIPETQSRLHASYGTGVTNPTFFEQFGAGAGFIPNPGLTPEKSNGWDAGIEQKFWDGRAIVDVTYFEADLEDEIRTVFGFLTSTVTNLTGKSRRKGVEVQATLKPMDDLDLTGSYTYIDSKDPQGVREIRRPRHAASLNAVWRFMDDRGKAGIGLAYNGEMTDTRFLSVAPFSQNVMLDDYLLVTLTGSYAVREGVELFGRVENLLDQDYEELFSFNTPGVAAYGGVRVKLGLADGRLLP